MRYSRLRAYVHFSPWPIQISGCLFGGVSSVVICLKTRIITRIIVCFLLIVAVITLWFRDMCWEAESGEYSFQVYDNLKLRFSLFVLREVIFLVSFFWRFFHFSLSPSIFIGLVWPPFGVEPISPLGLPLFNTILLVRRGVTVTWGHHTLVSGEKLETLMALIFRGLLGGLFMFNQFVELKEARFSVRDRVLGRVFLVLTGFHGFHVFVGLILLFLGGFRLALYRFRRAIHVRMEVSIWYWHFVDCVWLLVYSFIYWWGG